MRLTHALATFVLLPVSLAAAPPEERGAQAAAKETPPTADGGMVVESHASNTRTALATGRAPLIGFIDSQAPYCTQPDPRQDACYVNVAYTSVSASPSYIINLHMFIDNKLVFRAQGFFQTSLYVNASPASASASRADPRGRIPPTRTSQSGRSATRTASPYERRIRRA
ncbi:MAG: hypothetical protein IPL89_03005 [Acidobacteria bacterium]|nr:hypothetical protein [Acidobacteriota bacterium]